MISKNEYKAIHMWLNYNYGKANSCLGEHCTGMSKLYEWALRKGKEHKRDIDNYIPLCRSCHRSYDMNEESRKKLLRGAKKPRSEKYKQFIREKLSGAGNHMYGKFGEDSPASKISNEDRKKIAQMRRNGAKLIEISNHYNISISHAYRVATTYAD